MPNIMQAANYLLDSLIDNDVARIKKLGDRRSKLLREIREIESEIIETSNHIQEMHSTKYINQCSLTVTIGLRR